MAMFFVKDGKVAEASSYDEAGALVAQGYSQVDAANVGKYAAPVAPETPVDAPAAPELPPVDAPETPAPPAATELPPVETPAAN
jgi:hypothetical protein